MAIPLHSFQLEDTTRRLKEHLHMLTVAIGERSPRLPRNLKRTQDYIESFYGELGLEVSIEPYRYRDFTPANVIGRINFTPHPSRSFILGAHYDSVPGTVGADDNASAIAVQLETARHLAALKHSTNLDIAIEFASYALEEAPAFSTQSMGSRVHAKKLKDAGSRIDGMLCLEMVGYSCHEPGCQTYPFFLRFLNYPKEGNFIGVVGNSNSRELTRSLRLSFRKNTSLPVQTVTVPFNGWPIPSVRRSDHASFWDYRFKAVMITDSAFYRNPHYHLTSDTMDKLDFPFMAQLVRSLLFFFCSHAK